MNKLHDKENGDTHLRETLWFAMVVNNEHINPVTMVENLIPRMEIKGVRTYLNLVAIRKCLRDVCRNTDSTGIALETSVPYAHHTNAENFVKQFK